MHKHRADNVSGLIYLYINNLTYLAQDDLIYLAQDVTIQTGIFTSQELGRHQFLIEKKIGPLVKATGSESQR